MANSVLAGILVLMGALWALVAFNRLWREGFQEEGAEAVARLQSLGWQPVPHPLRARLEWAGTLGGKRASVTWLGGALGARCRVRVGGVVTLTEPLYAAADVERALSLGAPEAAPSEA